MKGKSYHHIDEDIRYLVACMNAYGFRTYASCQGHGYPVDSVMPYIAFRCRTEPVSRLSRYLREDAESGESELNWGWDITGSFDSAHLLCFRLSPTKPHNITCRWRRKTIRHDLTALPAFIKVSGGMR